MFQISKQLDPVTVSKIKKSAEIALAGFAVAVIPMLQQQILTFLAGHPLLVAFITAFGGWAYNSIKEWYQGQDQSDPQP